MDPGPEPTAKPARLGCGLLSRDSLEHVAAARVDHRMKADELTLAHVLLCRECTEAVNRLVTHRRLVDELARTELAPPTLSRDEVADKSPIPGFRLKDEIHRGGQGTVYRAEQVATRRECAVKMLIGGKFATPAQRARFEREVEVVGALRHPGIVTLYESGLSRQGEPWFAMELVDGERLDEFVKRTQPSRRELAHLFQRIAEAVAYAHRRGVIHRDLKPGNILIDREGSPRVLDFGLARSALSEGLRNLTIDSTQGGEFVGTFNYAAPEQLANDPSAVDSRCDLYALGVVLYECLTGVLPFDAAKSIAELVLQKSKGNVRRPSEALPPGAQPIDRDLEVIVMRLLAAEPARRYDTADALAEDLARYLDGRPILAREDSLTYVVTKTLRRHWIYSSLGAALFMTVLGAAIALGVAFQQAEAERARVDLAFRAFRDALESADPETGAGASTMTVAEFLTHVDKRVQSELASEPESLADIQLTIGLVQLGFDESVHTSDSIFKAYEVISKGHEEGRVPDEQYARAALALARLRFQRGDFAGSEAAYRDALEVRERALGPFALETVDTLRQLSAPVRRLGRLDETQALLDDALRRAEKLSRNQDSAVATAAVLNSRALLALARNDDELARREFKATLDAIAPFVAPDDFRVGRTLFSLARAEFALGNRTEALEHARNAHDILRMRKGEAARSTQEASALVREIESSK